MNDRTGARVVAELRRRASALGLDAFGVTTPDVRPDLEDKLRNALARGWQDGMDWMAGTAARRARPRALWSGVRSVVMVGLSYAPDTDPLQTLTRRSLGTISVYARNRDYHHVLKGKLKELAGLLARRTGGEVKVFVDTAPVMEKPLAEAAGLGWQGKHTVLVSRGFGSWLFLGAIFSTAELPADAPHGEACGTCRRCLDICPTDAFPAPFQLDARRCISYLTIEHKGPIPHEFRGTIGNRIYGCDDCLAVCPWNKFAGTARETKLAARDDLRAPALAELAALDETRFRALFAGSPIKRIGYPRFMRNVMIAVGNSGDPALLPLAIRRLSASEPLIRGAAVWAVRQLAPPEAALELRLAFLGGERDMGVRAEWERQDLSTP